MSQSSLLPLETITHRILLLREHKVLLDADLAALYGVETKVLLQAVKRNLERFPEDFMFQLTEEEWAVLRSQSVTSNEKPAGRGGRRYAPYAFTEQGVAMLSSILSSPQAVQVNIAIMRAYRSFSVAVGRTLNGLVATATTCTPVLPAAAATARRRRGSCSSEWTKQA